MSTTLRIPIDGLSRCLCPSIDSLTLPYVLRISNPIIRATKRPCANNQAPHSSRLCQRLRGFNTYPAKSRLFKTNIVADPQPQPQPQPVQDRDLTIEELHELLRSAPYSEENTWGNAYERTTALVRHLITVRGEKPSLIHYNALISINADAELGSAAVVTDLLEDIKVQGINADAALYHNVLQVLAIHPDYVLRAQILEEMKERWIPLTPTGYQSLILGQLRDHQFEMALSTLQKAQANSIPIPSYVYDIVTYTLLNISDLDTALTLIQSRVANHGVSGVSASVWYYMLSICASAFHYPSIKYIWQKRVEPSYINPSDGMCTAILNTAARYNDPALATDVIRVLANRKVRIDTHHYEALLEAYIGTGDVKTAMRILCIMRKAKLEPDGASTRGIVLWLREAENEKFLRKAWGMLKELQSDGHVVPTAAANAVLEAFTSIGKLEDAIEAYKELHVVCADGADTETFNVLLKGCSGRETSRDGRDKKALAMFLAAEMRALKVEASELTYDRLIIICLDEGDSGSPSEPQHDNIEEVKKEVVDESPSSESQNDGIKDEDKKEEEVSTVEKSDDYEDAFRYYEEMKEVGGARGWKPRPGTYRVMVQKFVVKEPERAQALMREMEKFGMSTGRLRSDLRDLGFLIVDEPVPVDHGRSLEGLSRTERRRRIKEDFAESTRVDREGYHGRTY